MNTEKNKFLQKKTNFRFFGVILWFSIGVLFYGFSILVPTAPNDNIKELSVIFTFVVAVNLYLYRKQKQFNQKENSLLFEKQEFEKKIYRKRMMPHYFFNVLEHLFAKCLTNHEATETFEKLKFVLYYFLVDAEKDKIELEKELAFYQYYIELENSRYGNNISIDFNILGDPAKYEIIPLLFEPLIGNAMKFTKRDGTGKVEILVDVTRYPELHLHCSNNYFSTPPYNIVSSNNGLKYFEERLELCYKNKYNLKTKRDNNLYNVTFSVNVK